MDTFSFSEGYYGFDDALYSVRKVLEILNENKKLSELVDEIPTVFNTPEIRIECEDELKFNIINIVSKNLRKENKNIIDIDGVRVSDDNGWWLLRASNTQIKDLLLDESSSKSGLEIQKKCFKSVK